MESDAIDKSVRMGSEKTHGVEGLHTNEKSSATGLPSPPSSVNATELDSGRNASGSLLGQAAASDLLESGASESVLAGENAGIVKRQLSLVQV